MAARIPPPSRGVGMRPRPVERLASIKNPNPTPTPSAQTQSHLHRLSQPPKPKPTTHPKTATCPNPSCPAPEIVEDEGQKVCSGCGTVISESNIVSEVTFGEAASGAAIVQGTFVGADQSHGRSSGPGFQRGGGMESREITEQNGNRYINQLSRALNIPESASKAASQVFKLAVGLNFIQGRRTKTVAAVCLYVACRRQTGNTVMLIDFADLLMVNVFKLGRAYKALLDELRLGGNVFVMNPIDPESLIYRFSKQLEFGSSMMQVASEAVRIVQRMNRDWMITGRRPAGICGAALILAARMNNFRRTVREVVYVVKVTELTIHQRLNEFKATESGELTVDQFRSVELESAQDPPAFRRAKEGANKRKAAEIDEGASGEPGQQRQTATPDPAATSPPAAKRPRRLDADGFAIPDVPIDPALMAADKGKDDAHSEPVDREGDEQQQREASPSGASVDGAKPARARPRGKKAPQAPAPTEAELAAESALEDEMTALLSSDSTLAAAERPPPDKQEKTQEKEPTPTTTAPPATRTPKPVSTAEEIDPSEFDSDPEVQNCLLSPGEVEIKERMWVTENKDYLRAQQAKALKRALVEADNPDSAAAQNKRPRKRQKGRLGDVGYLSVEGPDGKTSRASTPAEATRMMLEQRGFSKKINYKLLEEMYGDDDSDERQVKMLGSDSDEQGRHGSAAASGAGGIRIRNRSQSRSVSVVSDRGFGGGGGGLSTRSGRMTRGKRISGRGGGAAPAASPRASPVPALSPAHRVATQPKPQPQTEHEPEQEQQQKQPETTAPSQPSDPTEEIIGEIPESERLPRRPYEMEDYDEDEDEDEEEEDEDEDDDDEQIEAAFAGDYYDYGSDDDGF